MKTNARDPLTKYLLKRSTVVNLFFIAIVIAFGVNILAGSIPLIADINPWIVFFLGLGICFIALVTLVIRLFMGRIYNQVYKGFFVYDANKNEIVNVPRYRFSDRLRSYLEAGFLENKALKVIWNNEPLRKRKEVRTKSSKTNKAKPYERSEQKSWKIIRECAEYVLLETLSIHLTDYFNEDHFMKDQLIDLRRGDVPDVLLNNRFLELLSRPMEDRPDFVNHNEGSERHGETIAVYKSGKLYQRFNLVLPRGSKASRPSANTVRFKTEVFEMTIGIQFEGMNTVLPRNFEEYYLYIDPGHDIHTFAIMVNVEVSFRFGVFMPTARREYHKWLDSFMETVEETVSQNKFIETIGWDTAVTVIDYMASKSNVKRVQKK